MDLVDKYLGEYSGGTMGPQTMYGATGSAMRRAAKTGKSRDFTRGYGKNTSGVAAPIEVYNDPLDPRYVKRKTKRILWGREA